MHQMTQCLGFVLLFLLARAVGFVDESDVMDALRWVWNWARDLHLERGINESNLMGAIIIAVVALGIASWLRRDGSQP